jgi:pyruvate kinase
MLSKYRPSEIVLATSPNTATVRRMMILWGVRPVAAKRSDSTDELVSTSIDSLKDKGLLEKDDLVIMTAGVFSYAQRHEPATDTNIMRVVRVD